MHKLIVILSPRCPTPTQNYALAAKALLRTVQLNTDAVKNWAILDSGATSHFLTSTAPATNIQPTTTPIIARLPNGERVTSTHTCTLYIPALPAAAHQAHIIPNLASHSLILVVMLCNAGCDILFTKIGCTILHRGCMVLCANKCTCTGLWLIPLALTATTTPSNMAAAHPPTKIATNVKVTSTATEYTWFIHQALCSPPATTLLRTLERSKELATIPGFSLHINRNHLPLSTATNKDHMAASGKAPNPRAPSNRPFLMRNSRSTTCTPPKKCAPPTIFSASRPLPTSPRAPCTPICRVPSPSAPSS